MNIRRQIFLGILLSCSLVCAQDRFSLVEDWVVLQEARTDFYENRLVIARTKFERLYQHHNLFAVPFLEELRGTPLADMKNTTALSFFNRTDMTLHPQESTLMNIYEQKVNPVVRLKIYGALKKMENGIFLHWLDFAGNMGHIPSQFMLATALRLGKSEVIEKTGLPVDIDASFTWLEQAALGCDQNLSLADRQLEYTIDVTRGKIYFDFGAYVFNGDGMPRNPLRATELFRQAAEENFPNALETLLKTLERETIESTPALLKTLKKFASQDILNQNVTHQNIAKAQFEYAKLLIEKGSKTKKKEAKPFLQKAYENKKYLSIDQKYGLATFLTSEKYAIIEDHEKKGFHLFIELTGEDPDHHYQNLLGKCCEYGVGTPKNPELAIKLYEQFLSFPQEDVTVEEKTPVHQAVGYLYEQKGRYDLAIAHYDAAIKNGSVISAYNRAILWDNGWGCTANAIEARKLYTFAAEKGDVDAQYNLGIMYANMNTPERASFWYKQAQNQGHLLARHNRMVLFLSGFRSDDYPASEALQDLIQNSNAGCDESKLTFATLLGYENNLGLEKDEAKAIELFESLKHAADEKIAFFARIYLQRLSPTKALGTYIENTDFTPQENRVLENFKNNTGPIQEIEAKEMIGLANKPTKTQKRLARMKEEEETPQTMAKPADQKSLAQKSACYPKIIFSTADLETLEVFSHGKLSNINPRELKPIVDIFEKHGLYSKTKSGFKLHFGDLIFTTHNPHEDTVDTGAVTALAQFIEDVLKNTRA